jgi:hypothetical protein
MHFVNSIVGIPAADAIAKAWAIGMALSNPLEGEAPKVLLQCCLLSGVLIF